MEWLLALEWIAYGVIHSLLASTPVKRTLSAWMGGRFRYYRMIYSILALVLLVPMIDLLIHRSSHLLWHPGWAAKITGALIAITGILLSGYILKRYISSPEGFRDLFIEGETPVLQTKGFHQWVRHPLYLFTFMAIWGVFIVKPTVALLVTDGIITIYTIIAIRFEEKKLGRTYGKAYAEYKQKVPAIIPGFHF